MSLNRTKLAPRSTTTSSAGTSRSRTDPSRRAQDAPERSRALSLVVTTSGAPAGVMEVVEAELVESDQEAVGGELIEALLDSFLSEDGRLVPARTAKDIPGTLSDPAARRRLERAQRLDEISAHALAEHTLLGYGGHVRAWRAWARAEGIPALPMNPKAVADFLLDYALEWDWETDAYARDHEDGLVARVSMNTLTLRLQALNKLAEFIGMPRPGDNDGIKGLVAGLRRTFGVRQVGKAALDLALVNKLLATATGMTYTVARDRAANLMRARTSASTGQFEKLTWADIDRGPDGAWVELTLARTHRHGKARTVRVDAHPNPDLCLVKALGQLQALSPKMREVFTSLDGRAMSRQGLYLTMRERWDALPRLSDAELAPLLESACPVTTTIALRDRALLLVGFYTALRRSNLSALSWRDVTDQGDDGLSLLIRRSKTDQVGRGRLSWVPQADSGNVACPASALRDWKAELERCLGRAVKPDEPVFTSLTAAGTIKKGKTGRPVRLSGHCVNQAIQRLTVIAGIANVSAGERNPYGAHSLRAGFVTEAVRDDKLTILEVMEVTGHTSAETVARYRREANAAKKNAGRKLISILAAS